MRDVDQSELMEIFPGNSEMAKLMRQHEWESTALGSPIQWPDGLKIPLRMLLTSRFEMWLGWGPDLCFFYNDAYIATLGIKHPAILGLPFKQVWSEVYDDVADQVERVGNGEATWNKALLLLLERSGYPEETYHSFSYSPLYDGNGAVGGMLCVVTEETERVIADRRLATLQKLGMRFAAASDISGVQDGICDILSGDREDFPFALLDLNSAPGLLSCSDDAKSLCDLYWPDLDDGESARLIELPADTIPPSGPWTNSATESLIVAIPGAADGPSFGKLVLGLNPYRRRGENSLIEFAALIAGQLSGALANIATLKAERRRGDRIWINARDLMVVIGPDARIRAASPAWTRILGQNAETIIGKHIRDFVFEDDVDAAMKAFNEAALQGNLTGYESRLITADGNNRWIAWHTAMEDDLVYAYGRDVTEQKAKTAALSVAEDALRQAQKMEAIGQLTGGVAHDFNNLLTVIRSSAELLRRSDLPEIKRRRYLDAISETSDRAAKLTSQLLAFARRQALKPEIFEVSERVAGIADMLRTILGSHIALAINPECEPDECFIEADASQFETALVNMTVNARDAMQAGGQLSITIKRVASLPALRGHSAHTGKFIAVALTDSGSGINQHDLEHIFEPFFTTKAVGKGTGLGLSQVYGFAKQSGGDLEVESIVGSGTTITLYLPRVNAPARVEPSLANAPESWSGTGRILVVEDNIEVGEFAVQILEDLGYQTVLVRSATSALELLENDRHAIDLVFSDVVMPGMSGIELGRILRDRWPELPFVITSGYSHVLAQDSHHGFILLRKPYSVDELSQVLDSARPRSARNS